MNITRIPLLYFSDLVFPVISPEAISGRPAQVTPPVCAVRGLSVPGDEWNRGVAAGEIGVPRVVGREGSVVRQRIEHGERGLSVGDCARPDAHAVLEEGHTAGLSGPRGREDSGSERRRLARGGGVGRSQEPEGGGSLGDGDRRRAGGRTGEEVGAAAV